MITEKLTDTIRSEFPEYSDEDQSKLAMLACQYLWYRLDDKSRELAMKFIHSAKHELVKPVRQT